MRVFKISHYHIGKSYLICDECEHYLLYVNKECYILSINDAISKLVLSSVFTRSPCIFLNKENFLLFNGYHYYLYTHFQKIYCTNSFIHFNNCDLVATIKVNLVILTKLYARLYDGLWFL